MSHVHLPNKKDTVHTMYVLLVRKRIQHRLSSFNALSQACAHKELEFRDKMLKNTNSFFGSSFNPKLMVYKQFYITAHSSSKIGII